MSIPDQLEDKLTYDKPEAIHILEVWSLANMELSYVFRF
ncbi:hypothetical protein GPB2148_2900 [marine gamma proteobacterium HTCC2148]|jgi:hypothetical protein|nr:hypothetical protein GPB2148_2900 [marine gamma proteobacterium HTCC2148]